MSEIIIIVVLLVVGFIWGSATEKNHYASIKEREKQYRSLPTVNFKTCPVADEQIEKQKLVVGSTVVSVDYFKRFLAGLIQLVGGRMTSYESLVDRARREAILRLKEDATGYALVVNLRVETSSISQGGQQNNVGSIEVLAYGTAIKKKAV